jgi:hypothetical protein
MSYYLISAEGATISLGNIDDEHHKPASSLDPFNFPASGTQDTSVFDYGDTQRRITLAGTFTGTSLETIANWMQSVDALQNGSQETIIFHSDLWDATTIGNYTDGNFLVKVESASFQRKGAKPLVIVYNISLIESS